MQGYVPAFLYHRYNHDKQSVLLNNNIGMLRALFTVGLSILFPQVCEAEGEESMELPVESDGTLLLTTLIAQYPGACGLKYR